MDATINNLTTRHYTYSLYIIITALLSANATMKGCAAILFITYSYIYTARPVMALISISTLLPPSSINDERRLLILGYG
jgi:hypothetical protein